MGACFSTISINGVSIVNENRNNATDIHNDHLSETTISEDAHTELNNEYALNIPTNLPYCFKDIIDDKHCKYMGQYKGSHSSTLFWGIGIENESYLMKSSLCTIKQFCSLKQKRERYSIDYYKNFKPEFLQSALQKIATYDKLTYPIYINSHTLQNTDPNQVHKCLYDVHATPNPKFTTSLHDILLQESEYYREEYDTSFVFDGDSIEFITQDFYCTTVEKCVKELTDKKQRFLQEIQPFFAKWNLGDITFPDHNYGLVSFLTTECRNLSLCNNATYHFNITLPTLLENGIIVDKPTFVKDHLNCIECIQIVEPLVVACYGTPDVFSIIDPLTPYSIGSLRLSLSRYVSLQTFDVRSPINGKLLLMDRPADPHFWHNQLETSAYQINPKIGYDINFNKFKNHGIELRFFDWFPEIYVEDLINFFILLAQHSLTIGSINLNRSRYSTINKLCVQKGFTYALSLEESSIILKDLQLPLLTDVKAITAYDLITHISDQLYERYHDSQLVQQMSPNMKKPCLTNYNKLAFFTLHHDLFGKPDLIIRAEQNPLETRTPIVPDDISLLHSQFNVIVESSFTRCYSDTEYEEKGATIVPKDYWQTMKQSYVLGIKGIEPHIAASPSQTLLHFAHCFKQQQGHQDVLRRLQKSTFIDYEYMVDANGKRVLSFCEQSGKIGTYLALMAFYNQRTKRLNPKGLLPVFNEDTYCMVLKNIAILFKPSVLLIGYGTVGKACKAVLDRFSIPCTIWTSKDPIDKDIIRNHTILIHAIRLDDTKDVEPFLVGDDLKEPGLLSIICDISCELGHPKNTLPIYDTYTTPSNPLVHLTDTIDLIAIPYLPSLEPMISSQQFSAQLSSFLPDLLVFQHTHPINEHAAALYRSYQKFIGCLTTLPVS
jgi:alanine dehydrogenase